MAGYSVIRALDAETGQLLWTFDPDDAAASSKRLRRGWGSRGLGYWRGKIYTGTHDGRLIAVNAHSGRQLWSVCTFAKDGNYRFTSGAPRVFDGKVIIGHGGADSANTRGYVTAYDATTGARLWRFWTVPGDPSKGFENAATRMAARTWSGQWWKYGGGGTVWNAITYDRENNSILLGTGNGSPWNHKIRSQGKGDNLFLASIVAVDATTGHYKWHYQINPGESWDYNASMDVELADLVIDGRPRKVVMTAPKNGFFYVIDRTNGRLISAKPFARTTWAQSIDPKTGRPIENPDARFPDGKSFDMWPSGLGAHNWMPMAYSPVLGIAYIPTIDMGASFSDAGIKRKGWTRLPNNLADSGTVSRFLSRDDDPHSGTSRLQAWDPVHQRALWQVATPGITGGGVLATRGNLVFQGRQDGLFNAYAADTGERLWSFDAGVPIIAPPISYSVHGVQYVTVQTGISGSASVFGAIAPLRPDYRTVQRRILTFRIGGSTRLPAAPIEAPPAAPAEWDFSPDPGAVKRGALLYGRACGFCHGQGAISGGGVPDLRWSAVPAVREAFRAIVHDGALKGQGMPAFGEFGDTQLIDLRQYIRSEGHKTGTPR